MSIELIKRKVTKFNIQIDSDWIQYTHVILLQGIQTQAQIQLQTQREWERMGERERERETSL